MIEFKLPSLGADMDEGKLLEWKVQPGDVVRRGQVIAVVDTKKAAVDVESWEEGTVQELLAAPGDVVPVGTVIAHLLAPGETPAVAAVPTPAPALAAGRRLVSPAARRRAQELGVELDAVTGTGPHGAVTVEDVEHALPAAAAPPDRAAAMRQTIVAAMSRSKREIPHYYLAESIPLQRASEWLAQQNAARAITERLLMIALFLKAVAVVLKDFPELNGHYRDGAFQPSGVVNAGLAISLRQGGLIAPAVLDVGSKGLDRLMSEITDLTRRVRAGSLRSSELSAGTLTVSSLGDQGAETVFGVIYPPQVALVGFGRIAPRPWAVDGALAVLPVVTATLAADHRVSDGHRGGLFLAALRDALQQPEHL